MIKVGNFFFNLRRMAHFMIYSTHCSNPHFVHLLLLDHQLSLRHIRCYHDLQGYLSLFSLYQFRCHIPIRNQSFLRIRTLISYTISAWPMASGVRIILQTFYCRKTLISTDCLSTQFCTLSGRVAFYICDHRKISSLLQFKPLVVVLNIYSICSKSLLA